MTVAYTADLRDNVAGQAVMAKLLEEQARVQERSTLARLLGVSPLHEDNRPWYWGALGEIAVGDRLGYLGSGWHVLHAVPVGAKDADIDHVVVGPAGVFTINTKNHSHQRVWVGGHTFMVSGHRKPWIRNSTHEAVRASRLVSSAVGHPVPVRALVVVHEPLTLTVKKQPTDVTVVAAASLLKWLRKQPVRFTGDEVALIAAAAADPRTWGKAGGAVSEVDRPAMLRAFQAVHGDVRSAMRVRQMWGLGFGAGVLLTSLRALQSMT